MVEWTWMLHLETKQCRISQGCVFQKSAQKARYTDRKKEWVKVTYNTGKYGKNSPPSPPSEHCIANKD